jgi:hypothetical protein
MNTKLITLLIMLLISTITLAQNTDVPGNLNVGQSANLNTAGGTTTINGPLTTNGTTRMNNTLTVTGITNLGSLSVSGATSLGTSLSISGQLTVSGSNSATSPTTGALVVNGGVGIGQNLQVGSSLGVAGNSVLGGPVTIAGETVMSQALTLTDNEAEHIATFVNANGDTGDGIKIKLGRNHPMWDETFVGGARYRGLQNPVDVWYTSVVASVTAIKSWVEGGPFSIKQITSAVPISYYAAAQCNTTNELTVALNRALGLPRSIGPYSLGQGSIIGATQLFGGYTFNTSVPGVPNFSIPSITMPALPPNNLTILPNVVTLPAMSTLNCESVLPSVPAFPILNPGNVRNSLTVENEFLTFVDKDDRKLGSVRAQGIVDWYQAYFTFPYFRDLTISLISMDLLSLIVNPTIATLNAIDDYNSIGVEYTSGNGDYAEWLERTNPAEIINAGDVVGVRAGKISKDLTGAEQVMAVSGKPIMLGNVPPAGREHLGNKIAFMGQIPVKAMGPVNSGDYLVADPVVLGYAVAVAPANMTPDQLKRAVGRAWETKLTDGPKLVNTIIGIHNGDYVNILKQLQQKIQQTEARMDAIEARLNRMIK